MSAPQVNITVTSYNRLASTRRCLESLNHTAGICYTLTVVDNNSSDGSREYLVSLFEAGAIDRLFLCKYNAGVSVAANLGWAAVDAPYYVKLDNDVELLRPDWLSNLIELSLQAPGTGTMGYYIDAQRKASEQGAFFDEPHSVGSCILISR
ncbi:MAG: glycosyltransferase, partial [Deltaproteobacteria bacterium]|nr:glycosyltransferase [Deltaproteobacteria bacterium]